MARTVDELLIKIKADTKELEKKLKNIKGELDTTGKTGIAAFGGAGLAGAMSKIPKAAIGVTAALVGIGTAVGSVARVGAGFEDLKDSLDTVFGSMEAGNEAMQRVFDFAQTTPFQIETATKAFIALKSAGVEPTNRMLQVFADTASTSTDQLGVFEALVRTVQRSASGGLGLEELNMVMDRGIDVLGILNDQLGLSKDEIAKFGASAEGAKLITDALINGLERKFGGAMESKMDNLSTKTSNMTIAFKQLADEVFKSGLGEFLGNMAVKLTDLANSVAANIAAVRGEGVGIALGTDPFENIDALEAERAKVLARIASDEEKAKNRFAFAAKDRLEANRKVLQNIDEQIDKQGDLIFSMDLFSEKTKKLTNAEKESLFFKGQLLNSFTFLSNEIDKARGDTDEFAFAQENLGEIFKANEEAFAEMGINTLGQLETSLKNLQEASGELAVTFDDELRQAVINQSNAFTTDFVNSLMEGESALDSFKNFAQNMVSQIIAIFLQMGVVNEILNNVFNLQGDNKLATLDGNAGGGRVQAGRPTLVGERGAELFIPDSSGVIMNNMNTKGALGGGTPVIVNQSLNFATGVVPTVRAEVTKMLPQIADVTKGAVLESAMRGGAYARGLRRG